MTNCSESLNTFIESQNAVQNCGILSTVFVVGVVFAGAFFGLLIGIFFGRKCHSNTERIQSANGQNTNTYEEEMQFRYHNYQHMNRRCSQTSENSMDNIDMYESIGD
ncbi:uncharacterized protein LOC125675147 [Ostrea edulis]|uniref:uncharacterized protein LOC125675147 n=1 Tax=Ostrea edulis TaxID=37623 RepID=UPI002094A12F|nr:uncharacterized protein LOC125675147 [Ostrea edulis]